MYVKVKDDLAAGALVELLNSDAVGAKQLHAGPGDLLHGRDHVSKIVGRSVQDITHRRLGQDESMTGSARHDIEKSERLIVFIHLIAWHLTTQDLGEDIVRVVRGHKLLRFGFVGAAA